MIWGYHYFRNPTKNSDLYGGVWENILLGGGLKYFIFSPLKLGKISTLTHIFERGWNHQLDYVPKLGCVSRQLLFERLEIQALGQVWRRVWWSPFQALKFKDYYLSWMRTMEPLLAKYMGSVGTTCKYFESKKHRIHLKQTVPFCEDQWRAHGKLES